MATIVYKIKPGETLWEISNRFGVPIQEIIRENGIADPDTIYADQRLVLTIPPFYDWYIVREGDTLNDIAQKVGTTSAELARINRMTNPDLIYPGQVIRLK